MWPPLLATQAAVHLASFSTLSEILLHLQTELGLGVSNPSEAEKGECAGRLNIHLTCVLCSGWPAFSAAAVAQGYRGAL